MTKEKIEKGNSLLDSIDYCNKSLEHIALKHRLTFRYDTTKSIESHDSMYCPEWLLEKIKSALEEHRESLKREFEEL